MTDAGLFYAEARWDSLVVSSIIDSTADTSRPGAVSRICSLTSWARNSYDTFLRSWGSISICPQRIRILHIAMNEHGLFRHQSMPQVRNMDAPIVVLRDDIVCTRFSRRGCKVDRLEIPNPEKHPNNSSLSLCGAACATHDGARRGLLSLRAGGEVMACSLNCID